MYSKERNPAVCEALNTAIDNYRRKQWGSKVRVCLCVCLCV